MDRVLSASMLYAGAEGFIEESADAALHLVLDYGPQPARCRLLLRLWSGRLPELAAGLALSTAPFRDDTVQALAELDDAGRQVADLVRSGAHPDPRVRPSAPWTESDQTDASPSSSQRR